MNVSAVLASALLAGMIARAHEVRPTAQRTAKICMGVGAAAPFIVARAQATATQMYAGIGVKIEWHANERYCKTRTEESIIITLSTGAPAMHFPGALAYAQPYDGVRIEVFYDRVIMTAPPRSAPSLLAHVLAHEIAHVLQGVSRHSEEGVMKARWNEQDNREMSWKPLPFTPVDVTLIQHGMDARVSRLAKRN